MLSIQQVEEQIKLLLRKGLSEEEVDRLRKIIPEKEKEFSIKREISISDVRKEISHIKKRHKIRKGTIPFIPDSEIKEFLLENQYMLEYSQDDIHQDVLDFLVRNKHIIVCSSCSRIIYTNSLNCVKCNIEIEQERRRIEEERRLEEERQKEMAKLREIEREKRRKERELYDVSRVAEDIICAMSNGQITPEIFSKRIKEIELNYPGLTSAIYDATTEYIGDK